ncbi:MAG: molybdopterin-guanine dinucleotide biosynthesis protein B [Alphaproteobacteria bacterium GM202ARS2]|nr:molybdopterin-guanine dinucleotide biosynthesis protein B [Alphaproteobacteria bacterium GM202ARS2]
MTQSCFGIAGWSGSGKTTLLVQLVKRLKQQGLTVSTVKHAHHSFDIDQPGKDSHTHRQAGAKEVFIVSEKRWACIHELHNETEPTLATILAKMDSVDIVLVEGFKKAAIAKLEVFRSANGKEWLYPNDPHIVAIASDVMPKDCSLPQFALDDYQAIATFIVKFIGKNKEL